MTGVLSCDLRASFRDGAPVIEQIATRLPRTLEVILAAALIATCIGVPLGTFAAIRADGAADSVISFFASALLSTLSSWSGRW